MSYRNHNMPDSEALTPRALIGGGLALLVLMAAMLWMSSRPQQQLHSMEHLPAAPSPALATAVADAIKPATLVYRYSVIPGGVHSASELAAAMARDPVVRAHYADIDAAAMHAVTVDKARMVHVSYRIGDKIYWTRNKVRLAEGEVLLSDGTHQVRARCGNRIADEVDGMMLESDPATEELQPLFAAADDAIEQHPNLHAAAADFNAGQAPGQRGGSGFASDTQASPLNGGARNPGHTGGPISSVPGFMGGPGGTVPVSVGNLPAAPGADPAATTPFDPLPGAVVQPSPTTPGGSGPNGGADPQDPGTPGTPDKPTTPVTPNTPSTPSTPNGPGTPPGITTPSTPVLDPETPRTLSPEPPLVFAPPPTVDPLPPVSVDMPNGAAPIPEPGSIALFALAALALLMVRRRAS